MAKFRVQRLREQVQIEVSPVLRGSLRQPEARETLLPALSGSFKAG
jgi:hypothetical protein